MSSKNLFLLSVLLVELMLLSIQNSQAQFADTAMSSGNTFTASNEFPVSVTLTTTATSSPTATPTITLTPTPEIVINEISSKGDSNLEWIELFNKSNYELNITGWKIVDGAESDDIPSVSPIPAGGYGVIIGNGSLVSGIPLTAITITIADGTIGMGLNESGDVIFLRNSINTEIDSMSYGNNSTIFSGIPTPGVGQSLIRDPNGTDSDTASDWKLDLSPSIGEANSL